MSRGIPATYRARDSWYALFLVSYVFVIVCERRSSVFETK